MLLDCIIVSLEVVFVVLGASSLVRVPGCNVKKDLKGLFDELIVGRRESGLVCEWWHSLNMSNLIFIYGSGSYWNPAFWDCGLAKKYGVVLD
jgi:hypothetical protein